MKRLNILITHYSSVFNALKYLFPYMPYDIVIAYDFYTCILCINALIDGKLRLITFDNSIDSYSTYFYPSHFMYRICSFFNHSTYELLLSNRIIHIESACLIYISEEHLCMFSYILPHKIPSIPK